MKKILFFLVAVSISINLSSQNNNDPRDLGVLATITINQNEVLNATGTYISYTVPAPVETISGGCLGPGSPSASNNLGNTFELTFRRQFLISDLELDIFPCPYKDQDEDILVGVNLWYLNGYHDSDWSGHGSNYRCYYRVILHVL